MKIISCLGIVVFLLAFCACGTQTGSDVSSSVGASQTEDGEHRNQDDSSVIPGVTESAAVGSVSGGKTVDNISKTANASQPSVSGGENVKDDIFGDLPETAASQNSSKGNTDTTPGGNSSSSKNNTQSQSEGTSSKVRPEDENSRDGEYTKRY